MKLTNSQKIQNRLRNKFLKKGVKMISPETIFFSKQTKIGKNVTIEPYVVLSEKVIVGNNVKIYSFSHLENVKIENSVSVGPFARLRPGTLLKSGSKVGNFVEIMKMFVRHDQWVQHLGMTQHDVGHAPRTHDPQHTAPHRRHHPRHTRHGSAWPSARCKAPSRRSEHTLAPKHSYYSTETRMHRIL